MDKADFLKSLRYRPRKPGADEVVAKPEHLAAGRAMRAVAGSRNERRASVGHTIQVPPAAIPFML